MPEDKEMPTTDKILSILDGMSYKDAKLELELALTALLTKSIVSTSP